MGYLLSCVLLDVRIVSLFVLVKTNLQNAPTMMGSFLKWQQTVYRPVTFNFELQTPLDWDVERAISTTPE
jgi:hypothetical protein